LNGAELLKEVERCGARLGVAGGRIFVEPAPAVGPDLLDELRAHKGELIALLEHVGDSLGGVRGRSVKVDEICSMPLSQFAEARLVIEVRSRVLDETVIFASDNAAIDPGERRTVYRASELRELIGIGVDGLRQIHRAKRLFGGTINPS